jgi:Tol biopolymer transport system component
MNIDGSNQKLLTTSPPSAQLPQMTPDGQWVIYSTNDSLSPTLFKVPANGGEPVQISRALIWRHQISPDGSKIGCLYRESADQPYKIAILPLDGGPPVKVFDLTSNIDRILRWSNDGRALYYTNEREGVSNIWRLPVESGPPTKVTKFTDGLIRSFAWSRDGKLLAVSRGTQTSDVVLITGFK